jgi:Leucine-rich repeat (LRR) protein
VIVLVRWFHTDSPTGLSFFVRKSGWQEKINAVKSLNRCYSNVRDAHLGKITSLPALEELNLDSCPVGDWSMAHFAGNEVVPNLKSLDLADTNLTDAGMVHIAKFNKLTRLSLFYCNITNGGLRHVAQLKELQVLNLDSREMSDEGLCHLRDLPKLKSLDIFSGRIADSSCLHIARIRSLESLELCGGGIGDAGCLSLATLYNVEHLNLSQNESISNHGASALAATLTNLTTLNLSNTGVNSGVLRYFKNLTKLQSLSMYGCKGMDNRVRLDAFECRLPNLKCLRIDKKASEKEGMMLVDSSEESSSEEEEEEDLWANTSAHV